MSKNIIIAIDGPAGSGKSTLAKMLAGKLGFVYLDTGAMYRAVTYLGLREGIADNQNALTALVKKSEFDLDFRNNTAIVFINGEDVTEKIRSVEVSFKVSDVAAIPEIREELVRIQQQFGREKNIVTEGRDTTTVVFPEADIKVFLTASIDKRAERRKKDFEAQNEEITVDKIKENINMRDKIDSQRKASPLTKAEGSIEIDSSSLSVEEEAEIILKRLEEIRKI